MIVYQHDTKNCYSGTCEDYGGSMPHGCVSTAPPARPWAKGWPKWTGKKWHLVEDHRERLTNGGFSSEDVQPATDYWLPPPYGEDAYGTPAQHMTEIGVLPAGAVLKRPEKPATVLAEELRNRRNTRIITTDYLMMMDYPLSTEASTALTAYRQALRDLPQVAGFPWAGGGPDDAKCPWPVLPTTLTTSTPKTT